MTQTRDDFGELLLRRTPLLDVRAPVEFQRGAIPGSINCPLLNDAEREAVGIRYKNQGNDAAVALGNELVTGEIKAQRVAAWLEFAHTHPDGALYCFRGGQRSRIAQQWLAERGCTLPRLAGGYKAVRRFLLEQLAELCNSMPATVIGGLAGSGKTDLVVATPGCLDLEGIANHRGSAFGRRVREQPSTIDFEHALTLAWMDLAAAGTPRVLVEDESRLVGRVALPQCLWETLTRSDLVVLRTDFEERVARIIRDYVTVNLEEWLATGADDAVLRFEQSLLDSLDRVKKRLGGVRHGELKAALEAALATQRATGRTDQHVAWVEPLLKDYYDPMYRYQMERKAGRVVFEGTAEEIGQWWVSR